METDFDLDAQTISRGMPIYQAGEPTAQIYLLRSGLVSIFLRRGDKLIEIGRVAPPQILGLEAMHGARFWASSAIATNDVELIAIDVKKAQSIMERGSPLAQALLTSLLSKNAAFWSDEFEVQLKHNDPTPCPVTAVTKIFAVIYHAASYTGTLKNGVHTIVWSAFKKYCMRNFLESPVCLEQAILILNKLNLVKLEMIPVEEEAEGMEEIGSVHFTHLEEIREFYQMNQKLLLGDLKTTPTEIQSKILDEIGRWNATGKVKAG